MRASLQKHTCVCARFHEAEVSGRGHTSQRRSVSGGGEGLGPGVSSGASGGLYPPGPGGSLASARTTSTVIGLESKVAGFCKSKTSLVSTATLCPAQAPSLAQTPGQAQGTALWAPVLPPGLWLNQSKFLSLLERGLTRRHGQQDLPAAGVPAGKRHTGIPFRQTPSSRQRLISAGRGEEGRDPRGNPKSSLGLSS